ncbi:MAG: putative ribosomal small subunit methyltransferase [Actinomycetota bacterium]
MFVDSLEAPVPSSDDAHHLFRVLRLRDGESVTVSDGRGAWMPTTVSGTALMPAGPVQYDPALDDVTIAAAIPKGDRCEWMVQKLTEVGVARIILLHCARSVVRWDASRAPKQLDRLRRVAREAAMQSRRVWLPVLDGPLDVADAMALPGAALAEPGATAATEPPRVVVIGPEGGFSTEELSSSIPRIGLGPTVLRVETAALVAAVRALTVS